MLCQRFGDHGFLTLAITKFRHPYTGFFGQLRQEDRRIIEESLAAAGIAHKAYNYVSELSDGERQKAMIAKALAQQCPIILLDEPTAFLDVTSRIETMVLLHKLAVKQQKAILLSTHDLDLAIQLGDCLWLQEKSRPMACGTPEDLIMGGAAYRLDHQGDGTFLGIRPGNGKRYTFAFFANLHDHEVTGLAGASYQRSLDFQLHHVG